MSPMFAEISIFFPVDVVNPLPVLIVITSTYRGVARLSWPGWFIKDQDIIPISGELCCY